MLIAQNVLAPHSLPVSTGSCLLPARPHRLRLPLCDPQVLDGRKPTGGKLEVKVRLREPLSGQDIQMVTENWLVLEPRGL